MSREELIAALEKATGPDWDLDAELHMRAGWVRDGQYWVLPDNSMRAFGACPDYTASIDAALTLVPEGFRVALMEWDHPMIRANGPWQALLTPIGGGDSILAEGQGRCDHAPSPALALCIAALRARAGGEG